MISGGTSAGFYALGQAAKNMCFVEGTMVLTAEGLVAIECIAVGDMVIATDLETGETAEKEVKNTFVNETEELAHVFVDNEEIVCTPGHKFYAPERGWTSAIKLRAGDKLQLVNGEYVTVEKVQHELLEEPVKIYNFEVEDFHTYYVGTDLQVLVHNNRKCGNSETVTPMEQGRIDERTQIEADGRTHNNTVFRPTEEQVNSIEFHEIVGEAEYTAGGKIKGTIVDMHGEPNGKPNVEIKSGKSLLSSSYQLRLQVYQSTVEKIPYVLRTSRPVSSPLRELIEKNGGIIESMN